MTDIKKIAVLGSGVMGSGIAKPPTCGQCRIPGGAFGYCKAARRKKPLMNALTEKAVLKNN